MKILKDLLSKHRVRLALIGMILVTTGMTLQAWLFVDLPDVNDLSTGLHIPSIRITDRHGRLLYEVIGSNAGRNTVVPLSDIPAACRQATIATEDASFYSNPGVDLSGIVRAIWINVQGGEVLSGGSTITQQVARNILLDPHERAERSLTRKLRESILAYRLAQRYSKDDILSLYLNQTYYGNLAYGIDAAARAYFGKSVHDLDLAECALLAGLPQSPSLYDPLTDPEAAGQRQSIVLGLMVRHGYFTSGAADLARREKLAFSVERYSIEAPHFVAYVYEQLQAAISPEVLYAGGLEVRTTLDLDWQRSAEQIARRQLDLLNKARPNNPSRNAHGAALIALDPHTGQILVMLGSPDFFDKAHGGAINMALTPRQPGSALKPLTYATALDPTRPHPWTAATMIYDVRTSFVTSEGFSYVPVNYDHSEHGPVLVREALASSYNIPAVVALQEVGLNNVLALSGRLGISTLNNPDDYDLSLTLGGGDVRLLELTAAYAAFATGGRAVHPVSILEIRNAAGEIITTGQGGPSGQVIDPRVAWLITDILSDNTARAPAFTTHSILQIGRPAAVKTGTTSDYRDNWTIGYTPDLVTGVWVGNPDNASMIEISGVSGAGPIWHGFMRAVLKGQPEAEFQRPAGLMQTEICTLSGLLPTPDCPYTRSEWFIEGTQPTQPDTLYRHLTLDSATGLPANASTPPSHRIERVFLDLPPLAQAWARANGLPPLPDFLTSQTTAPNKLMITLPDANTIYQISALLPLAGQKLLIAAAGPPGTHAVTILLDGKLLSTLQQAPFHTWWLLLPGHHTVQAVGISASGERLESESVPFSVVEQNN
jgi:penicillin-binding protein 1C